MFGLIGLAAFGIIMTIVKVVRQQGRACPRCAGCPEAVRTISCQGNHIAGDNDYHATPRLAHTTSKSVPSPTSLHGYSPKQS